jgi:hypothetical protein
VTTKATLYILQGAASNAVRIPIAVALALVLTACGESTVAPQQAQLQSTEGTLALVGAKVYRSPTHPPLADGVVVIRNGRILPLREKRSRDPSIGKDRCLYRTDTSRRVLEQPRPFRRAKVG